MSRTSQQKDYGTMASEDISDLRGRTWSGSETLKNTPPTTFADLGVSRQAATVETVFGRRRPLSSLMPKEWVFAVISIVSILGAAGLTIERIINSDKESSDVTFAIVLLLTIGFCLLYVVNGLFGEHPYELFIFIIGTFILMIYSIVNYVQTVNDIKPFEQKIKLARLIMIAAAGPINIVLGAVIAREYYLSRNLIFRTVGANLELQNLCSKFFFTESLLKFDLQLELSVIVLVLKDGFFQFRSSTLEIVVLALGTVYACAWFSIGYLAIRLESKILMYVLWIFCIFEPIYIVYKFVDLGMEWKVLTYQNIRAAIFLAGTVGLVVRCAVVAHMVYVYRNFGKGMKERAYGALNCSDPAEPSEEQNDRGQQISSNQ